MRISILLSMLMVFPSAAIAHSSVMGCGFFTVPPGTGALVLDLRGDVLRKADVGLQYCVPMVQRVLIETTQFERQTEVEAVWHDAPCRLTVSVRWTISDLEVYYTKGGEPTAVSGIAVQVREAVARAQRSAIGREDISEYLHVSLRDPSLGFEDIGVSVAGVARSRFPGCGAD